MGSGEEGFIPYFNGSTDPAVGSTRPEPTTLGKTLSLSMLIRLYHSFLVLVLKGRRGWGRGGGRLVLRGKDKQGHLSLVFFRAN